MKFIKKNKIVLFVLLILVLGVGVVLILTKSNAKKISTSSSGVQEQVVKTVKPEDVGLSLKLRSDNKAVVMILSKLDGVSSVEYEVTYDAKITDVTADGESGTTQRGVVGSPIPVKPGDTQIKREIELGTCSRNVCKYDNVVSAIKFVIKVTYSNGEIGSIEQSLSL